MQLPQAVESVSRLLTDVTMLGSVLLLLSYTVSLALRQASAAIRHRLWGLTMIGLLLLPVLNGLPRWRWPILPAAINAGNEFPNESSSKNSPLTSGHGVVSLNSARDSEDGLAATPTAGENELNSAAARPADATGSPHSAATRRQRPDSSSSTAGRVPASSAAVATATHGWPSAVVGIWCMGVVLCLFRFMIAAWRTTQFVRASRSLADSALGQLMIDLRDRLELRQEVALLESPQASVALTCGVFFPVVILPYGAHNWPDEMQRAVLLHELVHVQRRDVAWQWLGRLACALYWFHPLSWLGLRQMRVERELACDDAVVLTGLRASDYAAHLIEVARRSLDLADRPGLRMAPTVEMTNGARLEDRIRALFDSARSHHPLNSRLGFKLLLGTGLLISLLALVRPVARGAAQDAATTNERSVADLPVRPSANDVDLAPDEIAIEPINGQVAFADGRPARGARITLRRRNGILDEPFGSIRGRDPFRIKPELAEAVADEQGTFAFRGITARRDYVGQDEIQVDVIAAHPGCAIAWRHINGPETVRLTLTDEAKLSGKVLDPAGNPVADAEIRLAWTMSIRHITQADLDEGRWPSDRDRFFLGMLNWELPALAVTDSEGRFTVGGLPAGAGIRLKVSSPRFASIWFDAATMQALDAETLKKTKRPVATGNLSISLQERRYPFTVRVVDDATGEPVENVTLRRRTTQEEIPTVRPPSPPVTRGVFELAKLPPRIDILAEPAIEQGYLGAWRAFAPENEPAGEIRLVRGKRVAGRVVDVETGAGIPNVQIRTGVDELKWFPGKISRIGVTDHLGRCVALLPPGTFGLTISGEVPGYLTHSNSNDRLEPIYQNVVVEEGAATSAFEFRLPRSRRIEGVVVDAAGHPLAGISYSGVFRIGNIPRLGVEVTVGSGQASFQGQSDADGKILISEPFTRRDAVDTLPLDIIFFDKRRRLVGQLLVDPRRPLEPVRVVMKAAGRISGRVVDEGGRPQAYARVEGYVSGRSAGERMSHRVATSIRTGNDGRFILHTGIPDRRIEAVAEMPGFERRGSAVRLDAATADHDLGDIVLRRPMKKSPELIAPVPNAAGLTGEKGFAKLTADYEAFRQKLLEARRSPQGWPTVPNSSTLAFARELLRLVDESRDAELDLKVRVWIVRQQNASNFDESEFQKLKGESAVRLIENFADRPELATCALSVIQLQPGKGDSVDMSQTAALKLLRVNPHKTVQAIACYNTAESQLVPRGYGGRGGAPDPDTIAQAIPLLERVVREYADVQHPWRGRRLGDLAEAWLFDIQQLQRGATIPELEWKDINGKSVRLKDYHGKVVVIDCCSIGSGAAIEETEHTQRLLKLAGPEKTATITVLYDDVDDARKQLEKFSKSTVLIAGDEAVRFFRLWNVQGWPTAFIIDAEGKLSAKRIRGSVIAEILTELLDQEPQ
ncbi:MAG: redoxin domain-containing protein [Planctomycetes bacterium]|nr:redoxin domain-containing protein [Planctomycetota bacterium]